MVVGHLNRADPWQDHYHALKACIMDPPVEWRRRTGRPRQTWLRTVETDLRPMNLGLTSASPKRCAQDWAAWWLVTTATSTTSPWRSFGRWWPRFMKFGQTFRGPFPTPKICRPQNIKFRRDFGQLCDLLANTLSLGRNKISSIGKRRCKLRSLPHTLA